MMLVEQEHQQQEKQQNVFNWLVNTEIEIQMNAHCVDHS